MINYLIVQCHALLCWPTPYIMWPHSSASKAGCVVFAVPDLFFFFGRLVSNKEMSAYEIQTSFTENGTYKAINPILSKVGDFTHFYIAIAICSVLFGFLLILNIVCCCSRYSDYWLDRHTGSYFVSTYIFGFCFCKVPTGPYY